ncbi:MAG: hypothetical protein JWN48_395 [Myxococcaceae bacterium]|nr:hypothetical protein [Myxococcaceae bacterium]
MSRRSSYALCVVLGLASLWGTLPSDSSAQEPKPGRPARVGRAHRSRHAAARAGEEAASPRAKKPELERKERPSRAERRKHGRRSKAVRAAEAPVAEPPSAKPARTEAGPSAAAQAAQAAASGVNAQIVREGDTSVKMMEFTGLGIEGRLKSPQLVYFVQRVRAEFERPELPHRSFMPELESTAAREPLR